MGKFKIYLDTTIISYLEHDDVLIKKMETLRLLIKYRLEKAKAMLSQYKRKGITMLNVF